MVFLTLRDDFFVVYSRYFFSFFWSASQQEHSVRRGRKQGELP